MSCLLESTYSVYVDGELSLEEVREVESHLIQCRRCRGLIVALEEEASALADLFKQRAPEARSRPPVRARARGLALGLAPTLAVSLLVAAVAGWIIDQRLPAGLSWVNPLNLFGAYEMAFDTIFMFRDAAPVFFDRGIAVGATAAMAAVLTFLVSALLRAVAGTVAGLLLAVAVASALASFVAGPSAALDLRWDQDTVEVSEDEIVDDTLLASGETIDIDGTVRGDLVAVGDRVTIRGTVEGNVFAGAREVLVTGKVDGSLHMGCERCTLEGEVTRSVYSGAERITLSETARVGRDVTLFGQGVRIDGRSGRDLYAGGEWIEIRGEIGRTARTHSRRLTVFDEARIGQDLTIEIGRGSKADIAPGAQIGGEVTETMMELEMHEDRSPWLDGGFYLRSLVFIVSAFLVGLALHALLPGIFYGQLETSGEFMRSLGFGFIALIVTPIVLVLCAITIVGIPIAILGFFIYFTLLFVSTVVVAALVGSSISGADPESSHGFGMALLLGLVVVVAAMNLPFVGVLLRLLIGLVGMGLLITTVHEMWRTPSREYA
jgi:anti-sigma factor RsiW